MLFLGGLSLAFSIAMCIHAVRSGQQMYWLFIILAFQPVGGLDPGEFLADPVHGGHPAAYSVGSGTPASASASRRSVQVPQVPQCSCPPR